MQMLLTAAVLAAFGLAAPLHAAESATWNGKGELGFAAARGNTDSETLNARLDLARENERWSHALGASLLYGRQDGIQSARRHEVLARSAFRIGPRSRISGSLRNERDRFGTNEYQWTAALGYRFQAIETEDTGLAFDIAPGYRWAKLQGVRVHNNEAVLRGGIELRHRLSGTATLYETLLVEAGRDNTYARSDLGLQVAMTDALALKAGYEVRHNTDAAPGIERTDSLTTLNLVYGF
jgi:putative salt-induced outer membrane protein